MPTTCKLARPITEHFTNRQKKFFTSSGHLSLTKHQRGILITSDVSNRGHGRIERWVVLATESLGRIDKLESQDLSGMLSVVCVECRRDYIGRGEKSVQKLYYLISIAPDA
ncbi:MAG: hypothetical protein RLZZ224_807 [Verrucomicrobiota bacterium]